MIRKLFGETDEEQLMYLKPRLIGFGIGIIVIIISVLLQSFAFDFASTLFTIGEFICVIDLLIFGWAVMRALFGVATVGALFSNNIAIGIIIFILYLLVGYMCGLIIAIIGLCRYFVLLKNRK